MIIIPPPRHLSSYIAFGWHTTTEKSSLVRQVRLVPDGMHGLVIQHFNGRAVISEENGNLLPTGFVYGQSSAPFINYIHDQAFTLGIFFKPHALKEIFKIDADQLTDGFVDLDDLAGYNINEILLHLQKPASICEHLYDLIWRKLNAYGKPDELITDSFRKIKQNIHHINTAALYKDYNISKRQFQRRFKERAGIPLNTYIRVIKFQTALQSLQQNKFRKLSDIAFTFGYADQSHFIRDFKFFTGHTPKEVINETVLFPENRFPEHPLQTRRHIIF